MPKTSKPSEGGETRTVSVIDPISFGRGARMITRLCGLAGSMTFLDDIRSEAREAGIEQAVSDRATPKIFDWLLTNFSFQGVSDQAARTFIKENGSASWTLIEASLAGSPTCPRLRNYWHYDACRYDKGSFSCSEPEHIGFCPVPRPRLRNGRLNQTAYSFFLFVRDIAEGDLVGWIDDQLSIPPARSTGRRIETDYQEQLIGPLRNVYGISDKILTMTLSELLLGASQNRPRWFEAGKSMIAIDSLVHNFLHRSGILDDCGATHTYGVGCYAPGGCADIVRSVAALIDARIFNPNFPSFFPRFVQHAIWRYCAGDGLNICNGNRIDDRKPCQIAYCQLYQNCRRKQLKMV